jgi:D-alanyl-lipoteichoic acid acyltransferase DltB (MBOAT superfamily)
MMRPTGQRADQHAASKGGRISPAGLAFIAFQLGLALVLLRQFQIESAAFRLLAAVSFGGFVVHALLPLRWRWAFFSGLSFASIPLVLGVVNGAWLIAIGAVLIGTCHLPVSARWRVVLLLGLGALLIAQRSRLLPIPWSEAIWPILGSIFMFRLIVYVYDLEHDKTPTTLAQSIGYFFMLPNACFPLFPVIDFKTWRRSHYSSDAYLTYQRGVDWIVRGIIHLVLYRYFYYHVTLAPAEVAEPAQLLQYLVANFMLYLRVSGLFHLVVGMLYLFGFHLPETHNRYLLASSFTDFWRRINIYWKDFMQKIFYFPAVFKLKRFGANNAIIIGTLYVFMLTWALHSYQWFWLRGTWLFVWQDILFWAVLGVLVVVNSLYEIRHGRTRTLGQPAWTWRRIAANATKSFATFWFICVLWSFWTSESIADWLSLWSALKGPYTLEALLFPALTLTVIVLGSIPQQKSELTVTAAQTRKIQWRERAATCVLLVGLTVVSIEGVHRQFGNQVATLVHSLRSAHLSRLDNAKLERGYYEGLLSVDRFNSKLWEVYSNKPANWLDVENAGLKRFVGGFLQTNLVPGMQSSTKYGTVSINRWGMRDQDYERVRPEGTFRAAVLGASSVMGWGVGDGATFEALLEEMLNRGPLGNGFKHIELLNFGVPGYQPPQQMVAIDVALEFQPQAVLFVATGREASRSANYLAEAIRKRLPIPDPRLQAIVTQSGVQPEMDEATALRHLNPHAIAILEVVYGSIGARARSADATPVLIFLPQVREGSWQEETAVTLRLASQAGFAVINLADVYEGRDIDTLRLAEWDDHPNALGHQLVAQRLFRAIAADPKLLFGPATRAP